MNCNRTVHAQDNRSLPGGDGDLCAERAELLGHALAETGTAAGDEDDLVLVRFGGQHGVLLGLELLGLGHGDEAHVPRLNFSKGLR